MKKKYIEPQMIVEDFTVSEMVAGNCGIEISKLNVVTYLGVDNGCDSGAESYWSGKIPDNGPGVPEGSMMTRGTVYARMTDLYDGTKDFTADGNAADTDYLFTSAYYNKTQASGSSSDFVCSTDPLKHGVNFGNIGEVQYDCSGDTTLLQNS